MMKFNAFRGLLNPRIDNLVFIFTLLVFLPKSAHTQDHEWERKINSKARLVSDGFYYIRLHDIAEVLDAHTYYSNKVRKAVLYLGEERITVSAYNPFVLVGDNVRQMPIETKYAREDILLPIKFFLPILKEVVQGTISSNGPSTGLDRALKSRNGPGMNITRVTVEEKANGTLIRVSTLREFDKSNISTRYSRRWLYLDILGGKINERTFQTDITPGLIKKVVPVQQERMLQLSFQVSKDISNRELNLTQLKDEILLSVPEEKLSSDIIEKLKSDREKWKIDKIVIDPGHGGKDPGAIGPSGVFEKDVVLGIAKRLKRLLEREMKIKVYMTRERDEFISLKERTKFANKTQGKLFISLHANWNPNHNVRGTTTYFLGLAKSDEALEIAQRENAVVKYEDGDKNYAGYTDENIILAAMAQNAYNKESQDFAAMIQQSLSRSTELRNRGVKQAGFYVLVGASMPNVLIETAFISNRREERLLKRSSFQQKMAEGIFRSIKSFKEKYEQELRPN
ncbi:N-acetylmuramoyl-L-alanine amidase [candidate division KSB1 bacterium]|nr:N-acetylmuramoyl-L-alanine amidase [candidate division KSB1 bacterium]NIR69743.1 N-acetylmuramoyl-L-alanine amidase [candidate division KSB1 bacterium]NIS22931.1 N-acetylmuramoyl-L-alanine amidase [candidate division KSB1 bacterium]NIT69788.1 N-acetylmuramoyl-L-alanine amidase [candidate division KSB1 bacterium]NIU23462.1 N-acetylmuramoyl-L-alanine amidase [candidate division KSB1 bacterium]